MKFSCLKTFVCFAGFLVVSVANAQTDTLKSPCPVTIMQDGKTLPYREVGRIRLYELESRPFRLQVPSVDCKPSTATFPLPRANSFVYLANAPLVLTDSGFGVADTYENRDILLSDQYSPRLIDNNAEDIFDFAEPARQEACKEFGVCPLPVWTGMNYWKFSGDEKFSFRTKQVDFKRITENQPLNGFQGIVLLVVYTKVKDFSVRTSGSPGEFIVNILETHPIVLVFK